MSDDNFRFVDRPQGKKKISDSVLIVFSIAMFMLAAFIVYWAVRDPVIEEREFESKISEQLYV